MPGIIKQALLVLSIAVSIVSFLISLALPFRFTKGGFTTKKALYYGTFWLLVSLSAFLIYLWLTDLMDPLNFFFLTLIVLGVVALNFAVSYITLSVFDKRGLRKKYSDILKKK